jgi:phosphate transport system ATP-binding protein
MENTPNQTSASGSPAGDDQPGFPVLRVQDLTISYFGQPAVQNVSIDIWENRATALIGPSGCGKSTLLRHLNRLNELLAGIEADGRVLFQGDDLYGPQVNPVELRQRIGMVFQKPNPFPLSIFENVAWGPRLNRTVPDSELPALVEDSLKRANLWAEVRDRLTDSALGLSGGQQQRLCIARAIAMTPEIILMDEPCSALDPAAAAAIDDLIISLKQRFTIVIASHDAREAARVADYIAVLKNGRLTDFGEAKAVLKRLDPALLRE